MMSSAPFEGEPVLPAGSRGSIRWGVLGNAQIARLCVVPAIQKSRNGSVRALASRSPENARTLVENCSVPCLYGDYDKLLADPGIDAVYIPLPNHLHRPWTLKALKAGKHVLCEKPMGCTENEAREMIASAKDLGLVLMEAFMYRHHPRTLQIKRLVADGLIGCPRLVRSAFCYHMDEELLATGRTPRLIREMGGGALLDVGCYGVSVARWLMKSEPVQVQAQAVYHPSGVDIHFVGMLGFPNGGFATVEASFVTALQQTFNVVGEEKAIELPQDAFIPWEKDTVFSIREKDQETGIEQFIPGADEYQLMVEHFGDVLLGIAEPIVPPEESAENMRVLDALAEAARLRKVVFL